MQIVFTKSKTAAGAFHIFISGYFLNNVVALRYTVSKKTCTKDFFPAHKNSELSKEKSRKVVFAYNPL